MNLHRCDNDPRVRVRCISCETWQPLGRCFADREGEAFIAYHCAPCVDRMPKLDWPREDRDRVRLSLHRMGWEERNAKPPSNA